MSYIFYQNIKGCLIFMWRSKGADASKYHQAQFSDSDLPGNIFFNLLFGL